MERIRCISITHDTAPVDIRERVRVTPQDIAPVLGENGEAFCLNTCNRTEVYWLGTDAANVYAVLQACSGLDRGIIERVSVLLEGARAVGHLFAVTSGLDSLVLGETQILGQVKEAYRDALAAGITKTVLNKALHRAFRTAKRIRTETGIGAYPVSVASQAVELAQHVFGDIDASAAVVVGAGEMACIAARRLKDRGVKRLRIVNRTFASALDLARDLGGEAGSFEDLAGELAASDIVITSTGASRPIITKDMVTAVMRMRKNRPLIIIDIALPRDVEPEAGHCYNCYLYDIDALKAIVDRHFKKREAEALSARAIVEEETAKFERWTRSLSAHATIRDLYALAETIASEQAGPQASHDALQRHRDLVLALRRMLHRPVSYLKEHPDASHIEYVRRVFQLDEDFTDRHKG